MSQNMKKKYFRILFEPMFNQLFIVFHFDRKINSYQYANFRGKTKLDYISRFDPKEAHLEQRSVVSPGCLAAPNSFTITTTTST